MSLVSTASRIRGNTFFIAAIACEQGSEEEAYVEP